MSICNPSFSPSVKLNMARREATIFYFHSDFIISSPVVSRPVDLVHFGNYGLFLSRRLCRRCPMTLRVSARGTETSFLLTSLS